MAQGAPKPGEKYLHFKNKPYQVITVAKHSETGEELVIYQALYGDFRTYARPLSMFISKVDHEKYPDVAQEFRFELKQDWQETDSEYGCHPDAERNGKGSEASAGKSKEGDAGKTVLEQKGQISKKSVEELLMDFYDAKTYEEKYVILTAMRGEVSDTMINNMAVVLDIVVSEGELDVRYEELLRCLRTYQKYETSRLH